VSSFSCWQALSTHAQLTDKSLSLRGRQRHTPGPPQARTAAMRAGRNGTRCLGTSEGAAASPAPISPWRSSGLQRPSRGRRWP